MKKIFFDNIDRIIRVRWIYQGLIKSILNQGKFWKAKLKGKGKGPHPLGINWCTSEEQVMLWNDHSGQCLMRFGYR